MESALRADGNGILAGMEKQFEVQRRSAEDLRHAADGEPDLAVCVGLMGGKSHWHPVDFAAGVTDLMVQGGSQFDTRAGSLIFIYFLWVIYAGYLNLVIAIHSLI